MDDKALRQSIIEELDWDPSIDSADIGVMVEAGMVTLTGHAATYAQKLTAAEVARRVKGVKAVIQKIAVRPDFAPRDTDEEIARRALNVLLWNVRAARVGEGGGRRRRRHPHRRGRLGIPAPRSRGRHPQALRRYGRAQHDQAQAAGPARGHQAPDRRRASPQRRYRSQGHRGGGGRRKGHPARNRTRAYERAIAERAAWKAPGVTTVEDRVVVAT